MVGQQSNGARILTDQLATAGRGKEEDVAIIIEVAESVVDKVTGCEVVGEKVIAWKAGVALGAGGTQISRRMYACPRVEAMRGEDCRATDWTTLVDVDVVGPRDLGVWQMAPQGIVVL